MSYTRHRDGTLKAQPILSRRGTQELVRVRTIRPGMSLGLVNSKPCLLVAFGHQLIVEQDYSPLEVMYKNSLLRQFGIKEDNCTKINEIYLRDLIEVFTMRAEGKEGVQP